MHLLTQTPIVLLHQTWGVVYVCVRVCVRERVLCLPWIGPAY